MFDYPTVQILMHELLWSWSWMKQLENELTLRLGKVEQPKTMELKEQKNIVLCCVVIIYTSQICSLELLNNSRF